MKYARQAFDLQATKNGYSNLLIQNQKLLKHNIHIIIIFKSIIKVIFSDTMRINPAEFGIH